MKSKIVTLLLLLAVFISCEKEVRDPCENVICENGGTCIDGQCECIKGFVGSRCENQSPPKSVTINRIIVTKYPSTTLDGMSWDSLDGPDLTFSIVREVGDTIVHIHDTYYENADSSLEYSFDIHYKVNSGVSSLYFFKLYDHDDLDEDDLIDRVAFRPYVPGNFYSTSINYTNTGFRTCITLEVERSF